MTEMAASIMLDNLPQIQRSWYVILDIRPFKVCSNLDQTKPYFRRSKLFRIASGEQFRTLLSSGFNLVYHTFCKIGQNVF